MHIQNCSNDNRASSTYSLRHFYLHENLIEGRGTVLETTITIFTELLKFDDTGMINQIDRHLKACWDSLQPHMTVSKNNYKHWKM